MNTFNRPLMLALGAVLFASAASDASAVTVGSSMTVKQSGFLTPVIQRTPSVAGESAAQLPHLRLKIELTRVENVVVAGSGFGSSGFPHASVKIKSDAADASIPAATAPALRFATPPSGQGWNLADNTTVAKSVNPLFIGVIENGCLGAPAMFDLSLDAAIFVPVVRGVSGEAHLRDTVFGPGNYDVEYTVRASDTNGNVSDIKFSGRATSSCSGTLDSMVASDWSPLIGSSVSLDANRGTAAADSVTCRPGTSDWCAGGFQTRCDEQKGSLSSEPDGGVTCTYPEYESESGTREGTLKELVLPTLQALGFRRTSTAQSAGWISLTCNGGSNCTAFGDACANHGGGASTEPDGGITCTVPDANCSGCD